ncbi:hypothetical protein [Pseudomonas sp. EA_65y_Pfl2_P74]|uniref:hypothetical protein n=1 Tax=Pseudomonas sp. EA_65y_Pfl2_P74 TaxID=3088694 RepID=UPI0030D902D9
MNKILLLIGVVLLASCSAIEHKPTQILPYTVTFHGANNAINPTASGLPRTEIPTNGQPGDVQYGGIYPLSYAVECNTARSACKHAVIQTELTYEIHEVNSVVQFTGFLKSTMGRKITQRIIAQPGSESSVTMAVSDDVQVIGTKTINTPISFTYAPGKRVVIDGLGGVQVIFAFDAVKPPAA